MIRLAHVAWLLTAVTLLAWSLAVRQRWVPPPRGPVLVAVPFYERRTIVAPSTIPNAGNGLFARGKISKGEVIGTLGGQLLQFMSATQSGDYVARLSECAARRIAPYRWIDSKLGDSHTSRINFAPSAINGVPTFFQNAFIDRPCRFPYVRFVAIADIEPGAEIWAGYGPNYNYAKFMYAPAVRDYFCARLGVDCQLTYRFAP